MHAREHPRGNKMYGSDARSRSPLALVLISTVFRSGALLGLASSAVAEGKGVLEEKDLVDLTQSG